MNKQLRKRPSQWFLFAHWKAPHSSCLSGSRSLSFTPLYFYALFKNPFLLGRNPLFRSYRETFKSCEGEREPLAQNKEELSFCQQEPNKQMTISIPRVRAQSLQAVSRPASARSPATLPQCLRMTARRPPGRASTDQGRGKAMWPRVLC